MSGGSYNYLYSRIEDEYSGYMKDAELEDLLTDFCKLLKDLEWCDSGDICEETYRKQVVEFKQKWLKADSRDKRLKEYIDKELDESRKRMYSVIGIEMKGESE